MLSARHALLGLQLGTGVARLVEFGQDRHGVPRLRRRASAVLPESAAGHDIASGAAVLARLTAGCGTRAVALELPLGLVYCGQLSLPDELDADALEPLVELEACRLLGANPGELALDFSARGADPRRTRMQRVLLVAARRQQVDERLRLVRLAGLRPVCIEVDALAARHAVLRQRGAHDGGMLGLLELDPGGASLQLWQDVELLILQRLPLQRGLPEQQLRLALTGALHMAVETAGLPLPQRLLLAGEVPGGDALAAALAASLGVEVAVFDPWNGLRPELPAEPEFTVASGLAQRRFAAFDACTASR